MFKKKITSLALVSAMGAMVACGSSDSDNNNNVENKSPVAATAESVKNNYRALAYAAYSDSLTTAQALQAAVNTFIASPSEANLLLARAAYKNARVPYQQSEIMRWDSLITVGKDLSADGGLTSVDEWEGQVNAWPLDENHIVSIIEGSAQINTALLLEQNGAGDNEANVTTGVHAVEFMLWGEDIYGTGAGAGERTASEFDVNNCAVANCDRRVQYLQVATDLLVADLVAMQAEWTSEAQTTEGTLAYNFVNSDLGLEYIIGSIHAMATDELAGARMNSGLTLGDPEEEHDCFSDLSHIAIYNNFQGVKNAFYGTYGDLSGPSIADLIKAADQTTFDDIDQALMSIESKMAQIQALGEDQTNPVKFDQIIGQSADAPKRMLAQSAVDELLGLDQKIKAAIQVLSLNEIDTSGGGDGD